ncbi:MAG: hypothetical protein IT528_08380 [Nitrosomonas sp.]|nr:hypothetical protein [Nitrosomonas sp.]
MLLPVRNTGLTGLLSAIFILMATGVAQAHEVAGPIDPEGNVPSFTAVAAVACLDDGTGKANHLFATVRDDASNPFVEGMQVTLTLFKGGRAISTTDTTQGDNEPSLPVKLEGGEGTYFMVVNKTRPGLRNVNITYHCEAANGIHTGTSLSLTHYQ